MIFKSSRYFGSVAGHGHGSTEDLAGFLCNIGNDDIKKEVETKWGLTIKKIKNERVVVSEPREIKPKITKLNFRIADVIEGPSNKKNRPLTNNSRRRYNKKDGQQKLNVHITNLRQVKEEMHEAMVKKMVKPLPKAPKQKVALKLELKQANNIEDDDIKRSVELDKHRYNIRMIMHLSNATPIRTHYCGNGFACCFCDQFFPKAADLKSHTIQNHEKKEKNTYMQKVFLAAFVVKLDITALHCNLCKMSLDKIEDLFIHVKETHNKSLFSDVKSQIVCFKFDEDSFKCIFCKLEYASFKSLLEHMNQHYKNYVCSDCDAGFVNQRMLSMHAYKHKTGTFECEVCKKAFDTYSGCKFHEKNAHSGKKRYKCFQCGEKFSKARFKREHMIEVHGVQYAYLPCLACDRTFRDRNALRVHTQRDHLMERRFKCTGCDRTFFTSEMMKNHSVVHSGSRDFKCEVCGKDFARKKTLHFHMRTHKEESKLLCQICLKVFYKQSTLDTHMELHAGHFSCEKCPETFDMLPVLQSHIMTMHGEMT